jgi:hypothetical protein
MAIDNPSPLGLACERIATCAPKHHVTLLSLLTTSPDAVLPCRSPFPSSDFDHLKTPELPANSMSVEHLKICKQFI